MQVSVIREDNVVVVDGVAVKVDCNELAAHIHAIQWEGKSGWIEFKRDAEGRRIPNMKIVDFSPYAFLIMRWRLGFQERTLEDVKMQITATEAEVERRLKEEEQKKAFEKAAEAASLQAEQLRQEKMAAEARLKTIEAQQAELTARLAAATEKLAELEKRKSDD